jgi:hypothetical protein
VGAIDDNILDAARVHLGVTLDERVAKSGRISVSITQYPTNQIHRRVKQNYEVNFTVRDGFKRVTQIQP